MRWANRRLKYRRALLSFAWLQCRARAVPDTQHVNDLVNHQVKNPVFLKNKMPYGCAESGALRRKRTAQREGLKAINRGSDVEVPEDGFFRRVLRQPRSGVINISLGFVFDDDLITHLAGRFLGKLYFFRCSSKNSAAGRPLPAFAANNARKVLASSAASNIF